MRTTRELALALASVVAGFLIFATALSARAAGHQGNALMLFSLSAVLMIGTLSWAVIRISEVLERRNAEVPRPPRRLGGA